MIDTANEFICDLHADSKSFPAQTATEDADVIHQTIDEVIDTCSQQPVSKVSLRDCLSGSHSKTI